MKKRKLEHGQSLVESAIIFPLTILFFLGVVDIGMLITNQISIREAAQEAVIYASQEPTDTTGITNRALYSNSFPVDLDESVVFIDIFDQDHNPAPACAGDGNMIEVTVRKTYHFLIPISSIVFEGGSVDLESSQANLILSPQCP